MANIGTKCNVQYLLNKSNTHVLSLAVARVNDDDHLCQVARLFLAAVRVDLPQQDSRHQVSGELQGPRPNGREGH